MDIEQVAVMLLLGAVAGWLAGMLIKGGGLGLVGNIIVGVLGAIIGGWLFNALGIRIGGGEWVGPLVTATAGASILLFVLGLIKR